MNNICEYKRKSMRVLYISAGDYKYGAPKALMELVLTLKEKYDVEPLILTKKRNPMNEWCDEHQIENYSYWYRDIMAGSAYSEAGLNLLKHLVKYFLFMLGGITQRGILQIIPQLEKIDLIHTNLNRLDIGGYLSAKTGIPQVCHLRELRSGHCKIVLYKRKCIDYLNHTNVRFFAISDLVKANWVLAGIEESKINVIYDGIDTTRFGYVCPKKFKELNIVCVGRIEENKGQLQIIEALHYLPHDILEHTWLSFLGEAYGEYQKVLNAKIEEYYLSERVKFLGYCNDIPQKLSEYNVGITSSKGEAFGRVTIEYMAAGLAVIASNTGANGEIISDEIDGLLYSYGDSRELSQKLIFLYQNVEKASQIAQKGKEKAEYYSKERNAAEIYRQYCEILRK